MLLLTLTAILAGLAAAAPTPAEDPTYSSVVSAVPSATASSLTTAAELALLDEALDTPRCTEPAIRKSWYSLSKEERKKWIDAVLCLQSKPSKATEGMVPGGRSRYDDFNAVHILQSKDFLTGTGGVHMVGSFHAWHRYFVAAWETALRDECGYDAGQPYWDWTQDADSGLPIDQWEVWNAEYGVGGNGPYVEQQPVSASWPYLSGNTGGGCVSDGPFVNYTINVGPGMILDYNPHCLHRGLNPDTAEWLKSERLVAAQNAETFVQYDTLVQGEQTIGPEDAFKTFHSSGHYTAGGDSSDFISSTSEPIFWLHHSYIDLLYWKWQKKDPVKRLAEVGGVSLPRNPTSPEVTLDDELEIFWEAPIVPIRDTMDIRRGPLCYDYE